MRLVSFRQAGAAKFGAAVDGGIVDLSKRTAQRWLSLREVIADKALGELAAAAKNQHADVKLADIELLPTIPNPDKILCVGLNYASHVGEVGRELPKVPSVFSRLHNTLVPQGGQIVRPSASTNFDFEGELAVVIGERCRHVPRARALQVIAGYTCFLDVSVRDFQKHSVTAGKNFPATGPLGPWILCQHGPDDGCACRKPAPGMVIEAASLLGCSPAHVAVIGDIGADVEAAYAVGARGVLVPNDATRPDEVVSAREVAPDLPAAVDLLLGGER